MDNNNFVANLGRVYKLLEPLETLPEYHDAAIAIHEARTIIQQTIDVLSAKHHSSLALEKVASTTKFLVGFFTLLERLKNYFNFCQQTILCGYGYGYKR